MGGEILAMHKDDQKQAIDWLRDWSKWLITINFAAATGCTLVAKSGAKGLTLVLLVLAVGAFTVSVICAALLIRASASVVERLPYATKESNPSSVFDIPAFRGVSLRRLAHFQFISMVGWGKFVLRVATREGFV